MLKVHPVKPVNSVAIVEPYLTAAFCALTSGVVADESDNRRSLCCSFLAENSSSSSNQGNCIRSWCNSRLGSGCTVLRCKCFLASKMASVELREVATCVKAQ